MSHYDVVHDGTPSHNLTEADGSMKNGRLQHTAQSEIFISSDKCQQSTAFVTLKIHFELQIRSVQ